MKLVITGSLGRVGRRLMAAFPGAIGIDRGPGTDHTVDFDTVDYDAEPMRGVLTGADAVIHLAAEPSPRAPDQVHWQSVINAGRLFKAADGYAIPRMVVASSGWAVPMPGQFPNAYGYSKRVMESLASMYGVCEGRTGRFVRIGWVPDDPAVVPTSEQWLQDLYWPDNKLVAEFTKALNE